VWIHPTGHALLALIVGLVVLMRAAALITLAASAPALACSYEPDPQLRDAGVTVFRGDCGLFEIGYRLEGNTLFFPRGGSHALKQSEADAAQAVLIATYGLVPGPDGTYVRTKGLEGQ